MFSNVFKLYCSAITFYSYRIYFGLYNNNYILFI